MVRKIRDLTIEGLECADRTNRNTNIELKKPLEVILSGVIRMI